MRRTIGLALAGAGAFLIALAVILPTYVTGQLIKFPLNEYESVTLTATGASYLSPVTLTEVRQASLRETDTIEGNALAGDGSTAVWEEFTYIANTSGNKPVEPMTQVLAFNRVTAELVQCCGTNVDGLPAAPSGIAGYVFPVGTRKQTYQVFDATLGRPVPASYAGSATVDGVAAYMFSSTAAPSDMGLGPLSAAEPEYYTAHVTYWVDPETGMLLKLAEDEDEYLVHPGTGVTAATVLNADLTTTQASVQSLVSQDQRDRDRVTRFRLVLPVTSGAAGLVALAVGAVLVIWSSRTQRHV
jgi:hypothetical protein